MAWNHRLIRVFLCRMNPGNFSRWFHPSYHYQSSSVQQFMTPAHFPSLKSPTFPQQCHWSCSNFYYLSPNTGALFLLFSYSGVSDSLWPHGLQPTKLLCQWDTQVRILEWGAVSSSRGSSWLMDQTRIFCISCIAGGFFTTEPPGKQLVLYQC